MVRFTSALARQGSDQIVHQECTHPCTVGHALSTLSAVRTISFYVVWINSKSIKGRRRKLGGRNGRR